MKKMTRIDPLIFTIDPLTSTIDPLASTCICNTTIPFLTKHCYEPDLDNCTSCNPLRCHKVFRHTMRCKKYNDCSSAYIPTPKPKPTQPNPTDLNPTQSPPNGQKKETIITLSILLPLLVILSISICIWIKKRGRGIPDEELPLSNMQQDGYQSIII